MLYVFHVDAGQMTTYDMNLTLQSVATLRIAIERKTKIPASSLVLLVSGGEVLQSDHMVSSYSAGTDTNPIYMFSKPSVKESHLKQSMCGDLSPIVELSTGEFRSDIRAFDGKSVAELRAQVEMCCAMAPTVNTVISCASLAQQFSDLSHEVSRSCDQLVHEQHLQHQGWAAVVANLEDIYNEFCERSRNFKDAFRKHRLKKEEYHGKLNALNEVLESLGKIPILPALQVNAEAHRFSAFDVFEETDFEGNSYRVTHPLDSSSDRRSAQDYGVDFKLSDEDVFDKKESTSSKDVVQSSEAEQRIEDSDEGVTFTAPVSESKEKPSLLHWILAQGNKASLQDILDYCQKGLALIDAEPLKEREAELYHILEYANMHGLKQIKGIEDRLYGLDQLLSEVKKLERDQHDQAASMIQCRERLNTAFDTSVLPTLVQSHWCQLEKLLKGHQTLVDIRRRIAKSKDELSYILKSRLEAVLMIENSMSVQDAHAMLSFQCFNRLARYFGIVAQLHQAPQVFVRAVYEVARRRKFSQAHLQWATDLAEKLLKIHDEEVSRRQEFNALFDGHFLKTLFPGMTELPPAFATQAPPVFDGKLPPLTDEDVEFISSTFPEFVKDVPCYDMEITVKFFQQRLSASEHEEKDVDVQVDSKDLESETDTSDFEKLSRQGSKKQKTDISTTCAPETMAVSTVTEAQVCHLGAIAESVGEFEDSQFFIEESLPSSLEWGRDRQDYMDINKVNLQKLQEFLQKLCGLCKVNIVLIREELVKLKDELNNQKAWLEDTRLEILKEWHKNNEEAAIRSREETQRLTVDHELELSDMKAALTEKDAVIESLKTEAENIKLKLQKEIESFENEHQSTKNLLEKTRDEIKAFELKHEEMEVNKQKEIKDLQEKMHQDYKAEIESLRSRFRLVALTNMDRSPSESSLEKIERTDVIEITSHNAIVMQTKENAEIEKDEAVRQAVAAVESEWHKKLEELKAKYETEKQVSINDATRRLIAEKDRQLETLREHEQSLIRECTKYRDTIQQLTDPDTNDYDALLKTQMATLENEKALLQQQVQELKKELVKRSDEGDKSRESDSDGKSSPKKEESRRPRTRSHTPVGLAAGTLSLSSCLPGHTVLVMWEPAHLNYTVMQEAPIMYFVHSDCLPALDLSIQVNNEVDRKLYAIATVESKDYCYAKKNGNRYHMPRGSRFYRVRVRPVRPHPAAPPCCLAAPAATSSSHEFKHKDAMKGSVLAVLDNRPLKKWLTYVHAQDMQKSVDTSQSTSSNTDEASRLAEVATGTLINLESPVSSSDPASSSNVTQPENIQEEVQGEDLDQLDSIETSEQWATARNSGVMQMSTASAVTDMECSVGRVLGPEPLELAGSAVSVVARGGAAPQGEELAEEASP